MATSKLDLDRERRGIMRLEVGLGVGEVFGIDYDTQKNNTFLIKLCKVEMGKLTETEISTRIATEKLGLGVAPEPKPTKRKYVTSPEGHKVKTNAEQLREHQWKKGQSGNPKGRPVNALSLTALLRKRLENHPEEAEAIINALVVLSKKPSLSQLGAIQMTFDRMDGRVAEVHKLEGILPVTLLFRPAEEVLALEQGEAVNGEFKEITEGEKENNE